MEFLIRELREKLEAEKKDQTHILAEFLLLFRDLLRGKPDVERFLDTISKCNIKNEKRKQPEKPDTVNIRLLRVLMILAEPEADLEDVHLRYISDYLRELRTKKDYWKKEFLHWNDIISQKNWKLYEKKVKDNISKHKFTLKCLDGLIQTLHPNSEDKNYFSQSLDPNRVQNLVTAIKEKENEENLFDDLIKLEEPDERKQMVQFGHIMYAIYATYPTDLLKT